MAVKVYTTNLTQPKSLTKIKIPIPKGASSLNKNK